MGNTSVEMSQEDAKNLLVTGMDCLETEGLAGSLHKILCNQDNNVQEGLGCHVTASDKDDIGQSDEERICSDFTAKISTGSAAHTQKNLIKSSTFPSLKNVLSSATSIDGIPDTELNDEIPTTADNCACARTMSLPTSVKLPSAMKGGREQQGMPRAMNLHVKWAPDVCDPPATSLSHTVRSHSQCPRTKKKDRHKHRHGKGKSSRGSTNERRHRTKCPGNTDSPRLRSQGHSDRVPPDGFGESSVEVMCSQVSMCGGDSVLKGKSNIDVVNSHQVSSQELEPESFPGSASSADIVSTQDSKCGTNFFRASLSKMHLSVAEAL